jgi:cell division septum initiation protein DivIVA
MHELAPDAIRNATLTRRLRGYDREETEKLLARVAESYDKVSAERRALSEEVASLRAERQEREAQSQAELDRLREQLGARAREITDLAAQIARFKQEQSKRLEDLDRLREELSNVRTVQADLQAESREQGERADRFALREKALLAQIAMLASQFDEEEATQAISPGARALPERADRAAAMLLRLDRVVETLERESRREAEMTLKKARERADEIVRSAELRRGRLEAEAAHPSAEAQPEEEAEEYDPVAVLTRTEQPVTEPEVSDDLERDLGEASWTSRAASKETPEPSR